MMEKDEEMIGMVLVAMEKDSMEHVTIVKKGATQPSSAQ